MSVDQSNSSYSIIQENHQHLEQTQDTTEPTKTVYDQDDFDFEAVVDPFKSSNKMMMGDDSPPLPRKTGGIDYDNMDFDAIADPFASSGNKMMQNSPPSNSEPAPIENYSADQSSAIDASSEPIEQKQEIEQSKTVFDQDDFDFDAVA